MTDSSVDAIVLGAGAAGLMCAAVAGQRGRHVVVIDHADEPGKKILISGGGRCNFTNLDTAPERYLSENPHFAKSALSRYTARDFLALVEGAGIAWHEKTLGQLFCDGSARQIVALLLDECAKGAVDVRCAAPITDVRHDGALFHVHAGEQAIAAPRLILATGGPAIPKMGATGFAYDVARQFGLKIVQPRPALVPLTLAGEDLLFRELSGIAADVVARTGKAAFREAALFTHRGLSGPAILQISSYWRHGDPVSLDLLPTRSAGWMIAAKRATPRMPIKRLLQETLPERLATALCGRLGDPGEIGALTDKGLAEMEARLANWRFLPSGTEGYAKAEVTAGGISTTGLSSRTMEARSMPGLHAIGEAVDVTGWLGGYNFQWAWASGWAAGQAI